MRCKSSGNEALFALVVVEQLVFLRRRGAAEEEKEAEMASDYHILCFIHVYFFPPLCSVADLTTTF